MRLRRILTFLFIVISILGSAHYFVWTQLVRGTALPEPWFTLATVALIALGAALPAQFFVIRRLSRAQAAPILWVSYRWMGFGLYLLIALGLSRLVRLGIPDAPNVLLQRQIAVCSLAFAVVVAGYGLVHAARGPRVRRVTIALPRLPAAARGYTIVQLTDVHIGPSLGREFAEEVVRRVTALAPDLIVITGDLIDGRVDQLREHVAPLAALRARDGVYYVTGNHEYYWDADAWLAHVATLGIQPLRNARVRIGDAFELAGVDDSSSAAMLPGHGEDIPGAVAGRDPALPLVLLAHHPSVHPRALTAGVDLQLSGHVHGGQMFPMGYVARLGERHIAGLYRIDGLQLYVSAGTGYWGPPLRVGTTAEITLITLEPGAA